MAALQERLRIVTRESRLAMRQAEMVAQALAARHPSLAIEIIGMTTRGDRIDDRPLAQVGGKGLFVKELEIALADGLADIAVHSMKDVPMELPAGFAIATFGQREDPRDAFVSARHASLAALPSGAVVGTSSLRRECQLRHAFPAIEIRALRGNVDTRLAKLDRGEYDAIVLAAAGLRRLGFADRIREALPAEFALPAIGQGILAIEHLAGRGDLDDLLSPFADPETQAAARAERALGRVVEGSCEVPLGALAWVSGNAIALDAFIGLPDGTRLVRCNGNAPVGEAEALGVSLGKRLLAEGGGEILAALTRKSA